MSKRVDVSTESAPKLHLRYIRLPNQVLELYGDLIYRSRTVVVGRSRITSAHSVVFDEELVLAAGFEIVFFELIGMWFTVGKIRDLMGRHTGYYCDIVTPPKLLADGGLELTDLFLDLWVSPDLRCKVLDAEEFENAFRKRWITEQLYEKAKGELAKLVQCVREGKFPPYNVKHLERKLGL
jgi:predicted RNA-binding protein associated with RNAse of E/G family